jgi:hypothetical protein
LWVHQQKHFCSKYATPLLAMLLYPKAGSKLLVLVLPLLVLMFISANTWVPHQPTASMGLGFNASHCSPVSSSTADSSMPSTSARD